jgi:hypothetical protein
MAMKYHASMAIKDHAERKKSAQRRKKKGKGFSKGVPRRLIWRPKKADSRR